MYSAKIRFPGDSAQLRGLTEPEETVGISEELQEREDMARMAE